MEMVKNVVRRQRRFQAAHGIVGGDAEAKPRRLQLRQRLARAMDQHGMQGATRAEDADRCPLPGRAACAAPSMRREGARDVVDAAGGQNRTRHNARRSQDHVRRAATALSASAWHRRRPRKLRHRD